jgi:hypothetical protein
MERYYRIKESGYTESKRHFLKFYRTLVSRWTDIYGKKEMRQYPSFEYYHAIDEFLTAKQSKAVYHALNSFFPELPSALYFLEKLEKEFSSLEFS